MKKHFRIVPILFLLLGITSLSSGQKLSNYYTFRNQEGGNLYFIFPIEDFRNQADGSNFAYDITYHTGSKYVTINYSYFTDNPIQADSLVFISGDLRISEKAQKIFVDFAHKKWQQRFTSEMLFSEFEALIYKKETPSILVLSEKLVLDFKIKEKKWKEYSDAIEKILYIIKSENE